MSDRVISWSNGSVDALIEIDADDRLHVTRLAPTRSARPSIRPEIALGPVELNLTGDRLPQGSRHVDYGTSARLRYVSHAIDEQPDRTTVRFVQHDDLARIEVITTWVLRAGASVLESSSSVRCIGTATVTLDYVSSFVVNGLASFETDGWDDDIRLSIGRNTLCGEFQWTRHRLTELGLYNVGFPWAADNSSKQRIQVYSVGTQPTTEALPSGGVTSATTGDCLFWQIEHNGSWQWEVGEHRSAVSLSLSGPTDQEHQWSTDLAPGEVFDTVPAAVAVIHGSLDDAIAAMTEHRRRIRNPHDDLRTLPVVFNDYMNCLQADPSEAKLLPVIDAAADLGCEVFCIDAGWYSDENGWWTTVGTWEESAERFPNGLRYVIDRIIERGMTPGLWIEPEVLGVDNPQASALPAGATFERFGHRIDSDGRYQLDFSSPAVIDRLDAVIDRIISDYSLGYLKFDYNINGGVGTDSHGQRAGEGLLAHNRGYLAWLDALLERHPSVVIESCASGAARADYATLKRHTIASTSDQADPLAYVPIAVGAATAITPEQAGIWVLPEPEFSDELIHLSVINGMIGRPQISGGLHKLDDRQTALVRAGIDLYKTYREQIPSLAPHWPLGLPYWNDEHTAFCLRGETTTLVAGWRRGGSRTLTIPLDHLSRGRNPAEIAHTYGISSDSIAWNAQTSTLSIEFPDTASAAFVWLTH